MGPTFGISHFSFFYPVFFKKKISKMCKLEERDQFYVNLAIKNLIVFKVFFTGIFIFKDFVKKKKTNFKDMCIFVANKLLNTYVTRSYT